MPVDNQIYDAPGDIWWDGSQPLSSLRTAFNPGRMWLPARSDRAHRHRSHRPDVRENARVLGNLIDDFNFNRTPRKPLILPVHPKTDLIEPSNATYRPHAYVLGWG